MTNNSSGNQQKTSAQNVKTGAQTGAKIAAQIDAKARRKIRARQRGNTGAWFGLGMMGLIGWSIVVPTLLGTALGIWLDTHHPGQHSWTIALLMAGLTLGCFNAWHWVDKEDRAMREESDHIHDGEDNNSDT